MPRGPMRYDEAVNVLWLALRPAQVTMKETDALTTTRTLSIRLLGDARMNKAKGKVEPQGPHWPLQRRDRMEQAGLHLEQGYLPRFRLLEHVHLAMVDVLVGTIGATVVERHAHCGNPTVNKVAGRRFV